MYVGFIKKSLKCKSSLRNVGFIKDLIDDSWSILMGVVTALAMPTKEIKGQYVTT